MGIINKDSNTGPSCKSSGLLVAPFTRGGLTRQNYILDRDTQGTRDVYPALPLSCSAKDSRSKERFRLFLKFHCPRLLARLRHDSAVVGKGGFLISIVMSMVHGGNM